ncbi:hypothetical protein [Prevotella melaninogenica]|uniref:Uncharacterized protein n=1 Tax=Prevotella melaninogenica TaxID=28132 RepID=A0A250KJQ9_9BACT|nr:hypothetical protein [Prevotella melaninogenica]BBA29901.1 hypothetical protein PMEL_200428 [Prevotella melaninogenica]
MESTNHLQKEYGTQRPFTVPENYFSELSSRVMAQIPTEEQKETVVTVKPRRAKVRYLRPLAAAAMTIGVVLIGFLAYQEFDGGQGNGSLTGNRLAQGTQELSASSADDFDQLADYFMIDESDMYAYLASEE